MTSEAKTDSSSERAPATLTSGAKIIIALVILLLILHQDNWFWTDPTLVFGFLPIGLFWHVCISIGAAITWFLATRIAWPFDDGVSPTVDRSAERGE